MSTGGFGTGHHPPTDDHDGLSAYAASAAPEDLRDLIREAEPLDDIVAQTFPANVRRRYDLLDRLPDGLAFAGDAVCSFNPTYGQGMTVAAAESVALRSCLADGTEDLGRRHLAASAPAVEHAWRMATLSDLDLPQVDATRSREVLELTAHIRRVREGASRDPMLAGTLAGVMGMQAPFAALTSPAVRERLDAHAAPA
jgi:2-polyprenyl-6-methoxyphenol hydroxylase-like FAD-dependent oxidoreductase